MLEFDIPGHGRVMLENVLLDVNGTIAAGGALLPGVADALAALEDVLNVIAVTADTHGTAAVLRAEIGCEVRVIVTGGEGRQKQAILRELGAEHTAVVGNGANDALALRDAAIGIVVIGAEGAARTALENADVVVTDVLDALTLLVEPRRLVATLRS